MAKEDENDVLVGGTDSIEFDQGQDAIEQEMLLELHAMQQHQASDSSDSSFTNTLDSLDTSAESDFVSEDIFEFEPEFETDPATISNEMSLESDHTNQTFATDDHRSKEDMGSPQDTQVDTSIEPGYQDENIEGGGSGGTGSTLLSEEEEPEPKKDKPIWLKPWFIITVVISLSLFVGAGFWLSTTILNSAPKKGPVRAPIEALSVQGETLIQNGTSSSINSDILYNGMEGVKEPNSVTDIVNRDPEVGQYIKGLKQESQRLQSELDISNEAKQRLAERVATANEQLDLVNKESKTLINKNQDLTTRLESTKNALEELGNKSENQINEIASENRELKIRNSTLESELKEARRTSREREQKDKEMLADVNRQLSQVLSEINKLNAKNSKKSQQPRAPLAELRYLGMDYDQLAGIFEVVRNGKAEKKPIHLKKGESLLGRGVVENVDDYGCITFTNGKSYQPINGACK